MLRCDSLRSASAFLSLSPLQMLLITPFAGVDQVFYKT